VQQQALSKEFALTWYRALTWYYSIARPFTAPNDPRLVTGQQGNLSPACQQLPRARHVCAGGSSEGSTKLKHGTKLGRTLCYKILSHFKAVLWESLILVLPPSICEAYPIAILLHAHCATYAPPTDPPPCMP